jgi:hypothetical protein
MAIDTPARIAVVGAGPIGLEAALYARFLGYDVLVFDRESIAAAVARWGHVSLFTPFEACRSTLGLAALRAQDENYKPPADDELLTGRQWIDRYLFPLSQTDLLADSLRLNTTVVGIGKEELLKGDLAFHEDRGDWPFRLLVRDASGQERIEEADCVLDCSGVCTQPNWLGHGGLPAVGEIALAPQIEHCWPDILRSQRGRYAGRHTLLVGGSCSAATNAVALAQLMRESPGTRLTWITRREGPAGAGGPITILPDDPFPARAALAAQANRLAADSTSGIQWWPRSVVERISRANEQAAFEVVLAGQHAGQYTFDNVIANVGFRPDIRLHEELQVRQCPITQEAGAPRPGLPGNQSDGEQPEGPRALLQPEPNYYVLGAKSFGRQPSFVFAAGLTQIRDVFTIIGDRASLDLYASAVHLAR